MAPTMERTTMGTPSTQKTRPTRAIRRTLTAAAARLTGKKIAAQTPMTREAGWQSDAEDMYDLVGELRFLTDMLAGRASKAKIYIGRVVDQDEFGRSEERRVGKECR